MLKLSLSRTVRGVRSTGLESSVYDVIVTAGGFAKVGVTNESGSRAQPDHIKVNTKKDFLVDHSRIAHDQLVVLYTPAKIRYFSNQ